MMALTNAVAGRKWSCRLGHELLPEVDAHADQGHGRAQREELSEELSRRGCCVYEVFAYYGRSCLPGDQVEPSHPRC